jgi:NADH-quinone oxidoreductase subunit J
MIFEQIFFALCALMAIAGALGTVSMANPIRCAMSLLATIVAIAGMYLQLHAPFLAAVQMIVYAGAVVVLFIFVIMLLGPASHAAHDGHALITRIAGGVAMGFVALQILVVVGVKTFGVEPAIQPGFGSIDAFGSLLFTDYLVPFEVSSFLLIVAIVGAVAVARGKQTDKPGSKELVEADKKGALA